MDLGEDKDDFVISNARRFRTAIKILILALPYFLTTPVLAESPTVADMFTSSEEDGAEVTPQATGDASEVRAAEVPAAVLRMEDKLGRRTPRTAVMGFLEATAEKDYVTAAQYLDLRDLPKSRDANTGPLFAQQLEVIIDRGLWINVDDLSAEESGFTDDGLPKNRDFLGAVKIRGESVDILLRHVSGDENDKIWKFANDTVAEIPRLYRVYGYGVLGEWLNAHLPNAELLGLQIWQWLIMFGLFAVAYLAACVGTWPVFYLLRRRKTVLSQQAVTLLGGPLRFLIVVVLAREWFDIVRPTMKARSIAEAQTLLTLAVLWFMFRGVDLLAQHLMARMDAAGRSQVMLLLRPIGTLVKVTIAIVALMVWVENLGFKATTLIAGLGVGGLAVALAAQKPIENLIGAITLYAAAPVRVGDVCRFGDKIGVVEEINLRATRIRTLDRTVVSVPNANFSDMHLENISAREKIRYNPRLSLAHTTSAEQVRTVLQSIRKELEQHPEIDQQNLYVRFEGFGERGLDLKSSIYVTTRDYVHYLEVAEELNLMIMDVVSAAGTELAEPPYRR